ncbi:hypothetical protein K435DRAFT_780006 [Dendrothele bispora CBS 962.96]|uniref:2'-phosphotransferase n=1 Tax=Dendrothele bispora (strain CBS 962.96) TaxID=1314807 RepID=A0A4S8LTV2_DENBC|nr:hypothetical protein K435DRAFT_780006 [Dendrothele bispora CBS 962.96]
MEQDTQSAPSQSQQAESGKKKQTRRTPRNEKSNNNNSNNNTTGGQQRSAKLRGLPKDSPQVRLSKTLSWLLRHGAKSEGLPIREDGYVKVDDVLENPKIKSQSLDLKGVQEIVEADSKKRYDLKQDQDGVWWIKANQGHSLKTVKLDLKPILSLEDIPSKTAVHGTTKEAWSKISTHGLSKMSRNHIHLAQGVPTSFSPSSTTTITTTSNNNFDTTTNIISGMRSSSSILIYIDIPLALSSSIKFYLSDNGVILSEGDEKGFIPTEFFEKVEKRDGVKWVEIEGWKRPSLEDTKK